MIQKKTALIGKDLTVREIEVLRELSLGKTYAEIANKLIIAPRTARKHIENIYSKLAVHNKLEAIEKAKEMKVLSIK